MLEDLGAPIDSDVHIEGKALHSIEGRNIYLDKARELSHNLTGDDYLSNMISAEDPNGYQTWKLAQSPVGITVIELVGFCVEEMRMRAVTDFLSSFPSAVLRERQDVKIRFEVLSRDLTISSVFARIEDQKEKLMIDDYGVSQTSLEQVFNSFAEVAEAAKVNTVDGV